MRTWNMATRAAKSARYAPSGSRDGYDAAAQAAGTRFSAMARKAASTSPDISTRPCHRTNFKVVAACICVEGAKRVA